MADKFDEFVRFFYKQDKNGNSVYQKHVSLYRATGSITDELKDPPKIPDAFSHIFKWFTDLDKTRRNYTGMSFAYASFTYQEIYAYFKMRNIDYINIEVEVLMMLDSIFLHIMNEKLEV